MIAGETTPRTENLRDVVHGTVSLNGRIIAAAAVKPVLNLVCYVSLCEGLRAGAASLSYCTWRLLRFVNDCNKEDYYYYINIIINLLSKAPNPRRHFLRCLLFHLCYT